MSDGNFSYLRNRGDLTKINVLDFKDLDLDNFRKTGRLDPGEIKFSISALDFEMGGLEYEILHNGKTFRFHPRKKVLDSRMKVIVSGLIDDQI